MMNLYAHDFCWQVKHFSSKDSTKLPSEKTDKPASNVINILVLKLDLPFHMQNVKPRQSYIISKVSFSSKISLPLHTIV